MSLPRVTVTGAAGEAPTVAVDGSQVPGVRSAQMTISADGVPHVSLMLAASAVDVELPAAVTVLRAGPTASDFASRLSPKRLEDDALTQDEDNTLGESFAFAVAQQAAEFDRHV